MACCSGVSVLASSSEHPIWTIYPRHACVKTNISKLFYAYFCWPSIERGQGVTVTRVCYGYQGCTWSHGHQHWPMLPLPHPTQLTTLSLKNGNKINFHDTGNTQTDARYSLAFDSSYSCNMLCPGMEHCSGPSQTFIIFMTWTCNLYTHIQNIFEHVKQ